MQGLNYPHNDFVQEKRETNFNSNSDSHLSRLLSRLNGNWLQQKKQKKANENLMY